MSKDNIIMGIDPGTNIMGYGIIQIKGKQINLLSMGSIHLGKIKDPYLKLGKIYERTSALIEQYLPDELAIEAPFYGKNVQSMLKLGRAQGVAMAAGLYRSIPIFEYSPRKIKQAITGNGNASKEQVAKMLQNLLRFTDIPKMFDATDALAVALCHFYQEKVGVPGKKSWKSFISDNPDRIIN